MSKRYKRHNYLGIIYDYCPNCKSLAERIGVFFNKKIIDATGWNCEKCGFKEPAKIDNKNLQKELL